MKVFCIYNYKWCLILERAVSEPPARPMANMSSIEVHNEMHTGVSESPIIDVVDIISQGEKGELRYL